MLRAAARAGRYCLVLGLVAGIGLPDLAAVMRHAVPYLVTVLLFLAAFRVGPVEAFGTTRDLGTGIASALGLQLVLPFLVLTAGWLGGWTDTVGLTALVLMTSAPSISGSPNITIMMGHRPGPALRLLVVGTALLPLTVLPIFQALPSLGSPAQAFAAALRLLGVIALSVGAAFALRALWMPKLGEVGRERLDGISAIILGVFVIGLMAPVQPALIETPGLLLYWLAFAYAVSFGLQGAVYLGLAPRDMAGGTAVVAGNRNVALFLVALPAEVTAPLLLFIGCYQIPMFTTPFLMRAIYNMRRA